MHEIQALIGSDAMTAALARTWSEARRRDLTPGLFIVPLRQQVIRQITGTDWELPDLEDPSEAPQLASVVAPLVDALRRNDANGTCVLVFTQYFGSGTQASVLVRNGVAAEPLFGAGAINRALVELGVRADGELDEFDTIGPGRWRSTEEIAAEAS